MTPLPSRPLLAKYRRDRNGHEASPTVSLPGARNRLKRTALLIMALIPVAVMAWTFSIVVPTAYETWRATNVIFEDRPNRPGLADQAPAAPTSMPESVQALLTATAEGTPASAFSTQIPIGVPDDTTSIPTPTSIFPEDSDDDPTATRTGNVRSGTSVLPTATATFEPLPEWNGTDPVHILLLGVDTRPSEESDGRSDTMIVVRVDPVERRVDMFSIPRDLAVAIPGFGNGYKINSAYPWGESSGIEGGGPRLIMDTIEVNFGISIDYYATVDIPGLERIIDTVGGVVVDVDAQLKDDQYPTEDFGYTRAYFPPGLQELDGVRAVQYARTRHADGDFRRSERQQQVLLGIRDRVLNSGVITKLPDLIGDLHNTVRTDLSPRQVLSLASLAQDIESRDIWTHSLAPYTQASVTDQGWFLIGDWDALRWITQNLNEDPLASNAPVS